MSGPRVVVLGAYLAGVPTWVDDVHAALACGPVVQHWARIGAGDAASPRVRPAASFEAGTPKFAALAALAARPDVAADLGSAEHLVLCDDDVRLPAGFLPRLLAVTTALDLVLAQPARSAASSADHAIVVARRGPVARQTWFVECGPVVVVQRAVFDAVLPFDLTSPMGWGYEYVWAHAVRERGLRMGVVDAVPVDHVDRPQGAHYDRGTAGGQQAAMLAGRPHLTYEEAHVTVREFGGLPPARPAPPQPAPQRVGAPR